MERDKQVRKRLGTDQHAHYYNHATTRHVLYKYQAEVHILRMVLTHALALLSNPRAYDIHYKEAVDNVCEM